MPCRGRGSLLPRRARCHGVNQRPAPARVSREVLYEVNAAGCPRRDSELGLRVLGLNLASLCSRTHAGVCACSCAPPGWPLGSCSDRAIGDRRARHRTCPRDGFVLWLSQEQQFLCRSISESAWRSRAALAQPQRVPAGLRWLSVALSSPQSHLSPSRLVGTIPAASLPPSQARTTPHPPSLQTPCSGPRLRFQQRMAVSPSPPLAPQLPVICTQLFLGHLFFLLLLLFQAPSCAEADVPARTSHDLG